LSCRGCRKESGICCDDSTEGNAGRFTTSRLLSDNGTMVGVKEPREVVLAPLAVPMSLGAAGRVRL
jgi:hypothetical protein